MKKVTIYTDGACSGNPGPGGWGAVLMYNGREKELSGFVAETTNNRMELTAAIEALSALKESCAVELYSDSSYLTDAFLKGWVSNWKTNGWRNASKDDVKNVDLWKALDELGGRHHITWIRVKGHADNVNNNRCDKLATGEIKKRAAQDRQDQRDREADE